MIGADAIHGSFIVCVACMYYCWSHSRGHNKESVLIAASVVVFISILLAGLLVESHSDTGIVQEVTQYQRSYSVVNIVSFCADSVIFMCSHFYNGIVLVVGLFSGVPVVPVTSFTDVRYDNMLRYEYTEHTWHCGSNDFENHITGMSTSLFFPNTSLNDINACCHSHDADYCCQIGRRKADEQFYQCLAVHCMESYCEPVITTYKFLLDSLGEKAYVRAASDHVDCGMKACL